MARGGTQSSGGAATPRASMPCHAMPGGGARHAGHHLARPGLAPHARACLPACGCMGSALPSVRHPCDACIRTCALWGHRPHRPLQVRSAQRAAQREAAVEVNACRCSAEQGAGRTTVLTTAPAPRGPSSDRSWYSACRPGQLYWLCYGTCNAFIAIQSVSFGYTCSLSSSLAVFA